jgi:hypothetical protein
MGMQAPMQQYGMPQQSYGMPMQAQMPYGQQVRSGLKIYMAATQCNDFCGPQFRMWSTEVFTF